MGVQELIVIVVVAVVIVIALALVLVYATRRGTSSRSGSAPTGQQPPPGYWWDGDKWNPPGTAEN